MCYTRRRREDDSEAAPPAGDEALNYIINTHCVSGRPAAEAVLASRELPFKRPFSACIYCRFFNAGEFFVADTLSPLSTSSLSGKGPFVAAQRNSRLSFR